MPHRYASTIPLINKRRGNVPSHKGKTMFKKVGSSFNTLAGGVV